MKNFYNDKNVKKYVVKTENPNYDLHHFDTPFRSLIVAPSVHSLCASVTAVYLPFFVFGSVLTRLD